MREKGIMAMAIFGNVITSLSWFGVNMLSVGLHSYGFMESAVWALSGFIASQLALVATKRVKARSRRSLASRRRVGARRSSWHRLHRSPTCVELLPVR